MFPKSNNLVNFLFLVSDFLVFLNGTEQFGKNSEFADGKKIFKVYTLSGLLENNN